MKARSSSSFMPAERREWMTERKIQDRDLGTHACVLASQEIRLPIYGDAITFPEKGNGLLTEEGYSAVRGVSGSLGRNGAGPDRL